MASIIVCVGNDAHPHTPLPPREAAAGPLILVVEDDWSTRRFICNLLKRATNALVMEASGPCDALSLVRSMGHPDLLISDIDLSAATTGIELAHEFGAAYPSMRVLLMSGGDFAESAIPDGWRFLAKPFPLAIFLDCVGELCRSVRPA